MNKRISFPIAIIIIIVIVGLVIGGVLAYQYWWAPGEEVEEKKEEISGEKSITIISPNGGEKWVIAKEYEIRWKSEGIDTSLPVAITLIDYSQNKEYGIDASWAKIGDGKFTTSWGAAFPTSVPSGDKYKIRVYIATKDITAQFLDESDNYFTIVKEDETADWKTYRNEKYEDWSQYPRFEMKYPDNWSIYERTWYYLGIGPERDPEFKKSCVGIYFWQNPNHLSLERYLAKHIFNTNKFATQQEINTLSLQISKYLKEKAIPIKVGGQEAFKCNPSSDFPEIFPLPVTTLSVNDYIYYIINHNDDPDCQKYDTEKIYTQMLSTFEFIE